MIVVCSQVCGGAGAGGAHGIRLFEQMRAGRLHEVIYLANHVVSRDVQKTSSLLTKTLDRPVHV